MATTPKRAKVDPRVAVEHLREEAQAWAGTNGLIMVANNRSDGSWQHAPIALTPASFPRKCFEQAVDLARPFNILVDNVARDPHYLSQALKDSAEGDEFTQRLLELYHKHGGTKAVQQLYLGIHRSDYMVDESTQRLLQIELNTISSSFGCLSARVSQLHQHMLLRNPSIAESAGVVDPRFETGTDTTSLPNNTADETIPLAIAQAHQVYDGQRPDKSRTLYVVFVVQDGERNYVDQRHIEYKLSSQFHVPTLRRTLADIKRTGSVDPVSKSLILEGSMEVSVAYFRAGYTPTDYPTQDQWDARYLIESSLAIKCPSIAYHLVGAKKVQQRLADPGTLDVFIKDEKIRDLLLSCFAGLWSLGGDMDPVVRAKAIANPERFVVKPQREGGGNNIYGEKVRTALETMTKEELGAHILMERIFPPRETAYLMRNAEVQSGLALNELGIYSVFLGDGKSILIDKAAGHLLRTKFDGVDEGGVASGFASLNSPYLT